MSIQANSVSALDEMSRILEPERISSGPQAQQRYGADTSGAARTIAGALRPRDAREITEIVRIAGRHGVPLYTISTGKNWGYGTALPVRDGCIVLDLGDLNRIIDFDPMLGIVTLEPGVTQAGLADFLEQNEHPFLVPVTGAGPHCSVLANALERGYGITPHVDHFSALTDIEAVLADGSVYRTAMREAAGEDLARLFRWGIGPYSTGLFTQSGFGIVVRASIKLARRPPCINAVLFSLEDEALLPEAVARIRGILQSLGGTVGAVNLMNQRRVLAMAAPFPAAQLNADGLIPHAVLRAMGSEYQVFPWTAFGTLYGTRRMVSAARSEIRRALRGIASRLVFISLPKARLLERVARSLPGNLARTLQRTATTLRNGLELVEGRPNETALPLCYWRKPGPMDEGPLDPARDGCGLRWYAPLVPMREQAVGEYVAMVNRIVPEHGMEPLITLTSLSDTVWDSTVPLIFDREDRQACSAAERCHRRLFAAGREIGCFPYRVGVMDMDVLGEVLGGSKDFHARLRAALDPAGILSPGRYDWSG